MRTYITMTFFLILGVSSLLCMDINIGEKGSFNGAKLKDKELKKKKFESKYDYETFISEIPIALKIEIVGSLDNKTVIDIVYREEDDKADILYNEGELVFDLPDHYGFIIDKMTITLPESSNLKLDIGTGDILLTDINNNKINIDSGTGDVFLKKIVSKNIDIDIGVGYSKLIDVSSDEVLKVDMGVGDIKFVQSKDAHKINLDVGTGNILVRDCNNLKTVYADSGIGNVSVSNSEINLLNVCAGVGCVKVDNSTVSEFMVDTGVGSVNVTNSNINKYLGEEIKRDSKVK